MNKRLLAAVGILVLSACGGVVGGSPDDVGSAQYGTDACVEDKRTIWGGQTIDTGTVTVDTTDTDLVITLTGANGWKIDEWHIYAGTGSVPVNKAGAPMPGHFPYAGDPKPATDEVVVTIPLSHLSAGCNDSIKIAVHTVMVKLDAKGKVSREETGFADWDTRWNSPRWGGYFHHTICCDEDEPPPPPGACVLMPYYWGQTPGAWPEGLDTVYLGSTAYTKEEVLHILNLDWYLDTDADVSVFLGSLVFGVRINVANGASLPAATASQLAQADAWFDAYADADGKVPYGIHRDSETGQLVFDLKHMLLEYFLGPDKCI